MPITLAIMEGRQEDHKFKASLEHIEFKVCLSSIVKPYLKIKTDLAGGECAGEVARWLRARTALVRNQKRALSTHVI